MGSIFNQFPMPAHTPPKTLFKFDLLKPLEEDNFFEQILKWLSRENRI